MRSRQPCSARNKCGVVCGRHRFEENIVTLLDCVFTLCAVQKAVIYEISTRHESRIAMAEPCANAAEIRHSCAGEKKGSVHNDLRVSVLSVGWRLDCDAKHGEVAARENNAPLSVCSLLCCSAVLSFLPPLFSSSLFTASFAPSFIFSVCCKIR